MLGIALQKPAENKTKKGSENSNNQIFGISEHWAPGSTAKKRYQGSSEKMFGLQSPHRNFRAPETPPPPPPLRPDLMSTNEHNGTTVHCIPAQLMNA